MVKDKITLNVLADIKRKVGSNTIISSTSPSRLKSNSRALIVFNGSNIDLDEKLREIKLLKDQGVSISIAFSFMGDQIIEEEKIISYLRPDRVYKEQDILELKIIADRYSYVVAPTLTISTMSKVAGGFIDNFISNVLWTFLYMDKPLYIDFTSTKHYLGEPCKNKMIERVINEKISAIKELGAIEIRSGNYLDIILKKNSHKNNLNNNLDFNNIDNPNSYLPIKIPSRKKIFTERDIEELARDNTSITFERGSILTPLAKDKIKSLGISIKFL